MKKTTSEKIIEWVLFGNGLITDKGQSSNKYNDFLKEIFSKKVTNNNKEF